MLARSRGPPIISCDLIHADDSRLVSLLKIALCGHGFVINLNRVCALRSLAHHMNPDFPDAQDRGLITLMIALDLGYDPTIRRVLAVHSDREAAYDIDI